jgi:hypothetical protein
VLRQGIALDGLQAVVLSWLTVVAVGLSPILAFFIALVIGRVRRRRLGESQSASARVGDKIK